MLVLRVETLHCRTGICYHQNRAKLPNRCQQRRLWPQPSGLVGWHLTALHWHQHCQCLKSGSTILEVALHASRKDGRNPPANARRRERTGTEGVKLLAPPHETTAVTGSVLSTLVWLSKPQVPLQLPKHLFMRTLVPREQAGPAEPPQCCAELGNVVGSWLRKIC